MTPDFRPGFGRTLADREGDSLWRPGPDQPEFDVAPDTIRAEQLRDPPQPADRRPASSTMMSPGISPAPAAGPPGATCITIRPRL